MWHVFVIVQQGPSTCLSSPAILGQHYGHFGPDTSLLFCSISGFCLLNARKILLLPPSRSGSRHCQMSPVAVARGHHCPQIGDHHPFAPVVSPCLIETSQTHYLGIQVLCALTAPSIACSHPSFSFRMGLPSSWDLPRADLVCSDIRPIGWDLRCFPLSAISELLPYS